MCGELGHRFHDCKMPRTVSNMAERSTKGQRNQANTRKHETYETLAGELTQSLKHEIVAIERSAGAHPRQTPVWARPMKKAYPKTKDLNNGVRHGDPHVSSKASVTGSSAEYVEAKKITSESCEQVNVAPAELVKENSPDVPSVPHKTQEDGNRQDGIRDSIAEAHRVALEGSGQRVRATA